VLVCGLLFVVYSLVLEIYFLNQNAIQQKLFEQIELIEPLKQVSCSFGVWSLRSFVVCGWGFLNQNAIQQKPVEQIEPVEPLKHEFVFSVWSLRSFGVYCLMLRAMFNFRILKFLFANLVP
jgi:hypothetical protein